MNYSTAIFLVDETVRGINGTYEESGKVCTFKTRDPDVKVDDIVVVPSDTRHKFTTFKVSQVDVPIDYDASYELKWIVGRVDVAAHKEEIEKEKHVIQVVQSAEQRKRREDLRNAIAMDQTELAKLQVLKA